MPQNLTIICDYVVEAHLSERWLLTSEDSGLNLACSYFFIKNILLFLTVKNDENKEQEAGKGLIKNYHRFTFNNASCDQT